MLVTAFGVMLVGAIMWTLRNSGGSVGRSLSSIGVERSLIVSAAVLNAVGFAALAGIIRRAGGAPMGSVGAALFVIAAGLLIFAEIRSFEQVGTHYPLFVAYVVAAFVAQALIGGAIIRTDLVPHALGWAAVAWSLVFLVVLPIATPGDMYYPVLHHVIPLAVGIALV